MKKDKYYFGELDKRRYIKKSHLKAVEKFSEELESWAKETGEAVATLYEDAFTSFTLSDIRVGGDGKLHYLYDGEEESDTTVVCDEETGEWYEVEYDGIMESIKFWRSCLRRAKRYWSMDSEKLDKIQDGEIEDDDEEEE